MCRGAAGATMVGMECCSETASQEGNVTAMHPPATWTERMVLSGTPEEVLELLTQPEAIARWTPVPFEIVELAGGRLLAGGRGRVRGRLAGRAVEFAVEVLEADEGRLALVADGPIALDVDYLVCPRDDGSELRASCRCEDGAFSAV